jgi:UDP-N-acetylglucosamine 2-epimerase (non-hydrolysing)
MMAKILFVFGTRPEAIKMAPLIKAMEKDGHFLSKVCVTGQHRKMLDQVLEFFHIVPDFDLQLMKENQTLADITAGVVKGVDQIIKEEFRPDYIIVQGDTTTAMAGALAAFYSKVKVIHIEAGLRSHDKYSPYPEELNRILIGQIADLHFAPTPTAVRNLLSDGVDESSVWNVGNTVIDALLTGLAIIKDHDSTVYDSYFNFVDRTKRLILVTGHRRENFGGPFENICQAIKTIAEKNPDVEIVYPVHMNPQVRTTVGNILSDVPRVHLIEPLDYSRLIWLLNMSTLVLTDSGGIQEEAPALGKPVLVLRDVTERTEGVEAGTAKLVGTNYENIVTSCQELLTDGALYQKMAKSVNPYGDGTTSTQIISVLQAVLSRDKMLTPNNQ